MSGESPNGPALRDLAMPGAVFSGSGGVVNDIERCNPDACVVGKSSFVFQSILGHFQKHLTGCISTFGLTGPISLDNAGDEAVKTGVPDGDGYAD